MRTCTNLNCPERKSVCCAAISESLIANEGTGCFVCSKCKREYIGGECTAMRKLNKFKLDFSYDLQSSKELIQFFDKWLSKHIGKRCKTRAVKCYVCEWYAIRDLIAIHF